MRAIGRVMVMGAAVVFGGAAVARAQAEAEHTTTCAIQDACLKL
ncbi:hypothetical protein JOF29_005744 [Kribbella aluminosa]|uniref:Uncharacterized protein n=1 Tax=Kribbella aluminosa TaxID=416017 RepID=A0ABS4USL4_9ACTN|nr:hypothetical protein [Kribbella aluminosa]